MKTVVISIGNSDDKLTQKEWSKYVESVSSHVELLCGKVHFFGGSANWMSWQNVCWWAEIDETDIVHLQKALEHTRKYFRQDGVAIVVGDTEFI